MGRRELGGKGPGLAWVIPHIPADSQGKRCSWNVPIRNWVWVQHRQWDNTAVGRRERIWKHSYSFPSLSGSLSLSLCLTCPHTQTHTLYRTLEGAVCYHTVKLSAEWTSWCDYTASLLPSFRTDWFIFHCWDITEQPLLQNRLLFLACVLSTSIYKKKKKKTRSKIKTLKLSSVWLTAEPNELQ